MALLGKDADYAAFAAVLAEPLTRRDRDLVGQRARR
jgi:hypothetical protein